MLQEPQNIAALPDPDHFKEKSSYPYLTLLERICTSVRENFDTCVDGSYSEKIDENGDELIHSEGVCDINLYPYSSLLQTFVHEANIKRNASEYSVEKLNNSCNMLNCMMWDLSYPLVTADSSSKSAKQCDNLTASYDMTFATKLKHIAESVDTQNINGSQVHHQIPFLLKNVYPSESEESREAHYSEKLKKICFEVQSKNESNCWEMSPSSSHEEGIYRMNLNFENEHFQLRDLDYHRSIAINQKSTIQNRSKSMSLKQEVNNAICSSKPGINGDGFLFEAIMKNVEAYSMMNHSYELNNTDSYQNKVEYRRPNLDDANGIITIEKKFCKHFKYVPKT